jgi:uncharacterized protein YbjT (DUF2867 family)
MQRVAIAGATGYIGGRIAPQLLNAGYAVRCLVRSPGKLQGREWTLKFPCGHPANRFIRRASTHKGTGRM